ncbi:ABC transporter ATP-binding protein [Bosea massiliensis]|uniref:ABC transporter ATP-binding protein n=1 Tax=Bosea massiliensis TaxID=151419 RepID=A0ABW0P7I9_9HYPH
MVSGETSSLLDVRDLRVGFGSSAQPHAVDGLSFSVAANQVVALVGESGCGKSTTALAIMGLLPNKARISGEMVFEDQDIVGSSARAWRMLRGKRIGMIFQEPMSSLNPVHRIGDQIVEVLRCHGNISGAAARRRAIELLDLVKIPDPHIRVDDYPHRLSGGQRQRVMIAMAIACEPSLLIADEPTTALDATIQAQILELIDRLRRDLSMSVLLISHDLPLVARWADRVVVMHHGQKMEELAADRLFADATHPYSRGLIGAAIRLGDTFHYRKTRLAEVHVRREAGGEYRFELSRPERKAASPPPRDGEPLLEVRDLSVRYDRSPVLEDVSFSLGCGETIGIVGESGSGKSTLAKAVTRLVSTSKGRILFDGADITRMAGGALRQVRRHVQMIFQDPFNSLNPRQSVGDILQTGLIMQGMKDGAERARLVAGMLDQVGLPRSATGRFPHEFSGGQKQRIGIARALILKPRLVVCDEPVSALDVSVQAQILNLLMDLKEELGLSYLFISHDLAVVQYVSDRVIVMKAGRIVEENDHQTIWKHPREDYTRSLIASVQS